MVARYLNNDKKAETQIRETQVTKSNYSEKITLNNFRKLYIHCESEKNWATFIFTITLANVDRFQ